MHVAQCQICDSQSQDSKSWDQLITGFGGLTGRAAVIADTLGCDLRHCWREGMVLYGPISNSRVEVTLDVDTLTSSNDALPQLPRGLAVVS
jgi:hypothetical protein